MSRPAPQLFISMTDGCAVRFEPSCPSWTYQSRLGVIAFWAFASWIYCSPPISPAFFASHCQTNGKNTVRFIYYESAQLVSTVNQVKAVMSVQTLSILSRSGYDRPESTEVSFHRNMDLTEEKKRYATISHSSGSTGLPKVNRLA